MNDRAYVKSPSSRASHQKRCIDIGCSLLGLIVLSHVMLLCAAMVKLTSRGPVFYRQNRVGLNFRPFSILKFRSMIVDADKQGLKITARGDSRITRVGRLLRKTKLDELPQLINVLRGDMSFVGPRPEVAEYVRLFESDYAELLSVRPGITDISSIIYRAEEEVLAGAPDPQFAYINYVLPEKTRLGKLYIAQSSLLFDLKLVVITILSIAGFARSFDFVADGTEGKQMFAGFWQIKILQPQVQTATSNIWESKSEPVFERMGGVESSAGA